MLKKINNGVFKIDDNELDKHIKEFVDSVGGIEKVIGCSRKDVYHEYSLFCYRNKFTVSSSNMFVRHLNMIYDTSLKLVSYHSTPTYIICYYQKED